MTMFLLVLQSSECSSSACPAVPFSCCPPSQPLFVPARGPFPRVTRSLCAFWGTLQDNVGQGQVQLCTTHNCGVHRASRTCHRSAQQFRVGRCRLCPSDPSLASPPRETTCTLAGQACI